MKLMNALVIDNVMGGWAWSTHKALLLLGKECQQVVCTQVSRYLFIYCSYGCMWKVYSFLFHVPCVFDTCRGFMQLSFFSIIISTWSLEK